MAVETLSRVYREQGTGGTDEVEGKCVVGMGCQEVSAADREQVSTYVREVRGIKSLSWDER